MDEEMIRDVSDADVSETVSGADNSVADNVPEISEGTSVSIPADETVPDDNPVPEKQSTGSERDSEEISRLRDELAREKETFSRLAEGYEELSELFPGADLRSMPDSFRENVRRGVPPAAAYALEMRRREVDADRAADAERIAREKSAGGLRGADSSLFSPDEVRAMSRDEVRSNFGRILESMKSW